MSRTARLSGFVLVLAVAASAAASGVQGGTALTKLLHSAGDVAATTLSAAVTYFGLLPFYRRR